MKKQVHLEEDKKRRRLKTSIKPTILESGTCFVSFFSGCSKTLTQQKETDFCEVLEHFSLNWFFTKSIDLMTQIELIDLTYTFFFSLMGNPRNIFLYRVTRRREYALKKPIVSLSEHLIH